MDIAFYFLIPGVAFSAFVMGFCGFGYGILCMALLSFATGDPERLSAYVMLTVFAVVTTIFFLSHNRGSVDWPQVGFILLGMSIGTPLGYSFILHFGKMPIFRYVFGIALIGFAIQGILRPHIKRRIPLPFAPFFGVISGILGGAFASGGPPVVYYLYSQEEDPRDAVSSLQCVFFGGNLIRTIVVGTGGRGLGPEITLPLIYTVPVVVAVIVLARKLSEKVTLNLFLWAVYILLGFAGIVSIVKGTTL